MVPGSCLIRFVCTYVQALTDPFMLGFYSNVLMKTNGGVDAGAGEGRGLGGGTRGGERYWIDPSFCHSVMPTVISCGFI